MCCFSLRKFKVTLVKNLYFRSRKKKGRTLWQFSRCQHNHFHSTLNQSSSIGFFNVQWIGRCEADNHSAALQNGHIRSAVIFAPSVDLLLWDIPAFMFYLNCPQEFEIFIVFFLLLYYLIPFFFQTPSILYSFRLNTGMAILESLPFVLGEPKNHFIHTLIQLRIENFFNAYILPIMPGSHFYLFSAESIFKNLLWIWLCRKANSYDLSNYSCYLYKRQNESILWSLKL